MPIKQVLTNPTEALKNFFRSHASGVAIVTGKSDAGEPLGFTATSLTSLGSNPPLVSFNVAQGASFYPSLVSGAIVNFHALGSDNLDLAVRLAGSKTDRFTASDWAADSDGIAVFDAATNLIKCRIRQVVEVEQNAVVIADVVSGLLGEPRQPLLYHNRKFATIGEELLDNSSNSRK